MTKLACQPASKGPIRARRFILLCASFCLAVSAAPRIGPIAQSGQQPPKEEGVFLKPDLVDLAGLDPTIHFEIRYATANNFLGRPVYREARAFLQRRAAMALLRAHQMLKKEGYGLLIFDGYRPWSVTREFWDATPAEKKQFVADPAKGSRHNRGCAVDLTLYDLKTGKEVEMPGAYDEMTERSYPTYQGGTTDQRRRRDLLRSAMEGNGYTVFPVEWWHFDFKDWQKYPIMNLAFSEIRVSKVKRAGQ